MMADHERVLNRSNDQHDCLPDDDLQRTKRVAQSIEVEMKAVSCLRLHDHNEVHDRYRRYKYDVYCSGRMNSISVLAYDNDSQRSNVLRPRFVID